MFKRRPPTACNGCSNVWPPPAHTGCSNVWPPATYTAHADEAETDVYAQKCQVTAWCLLILQRFSSESNGNVQITFYIYVGLSAAIFDQKQTLTAFFYRHKLGFSVNVWAVIVHDYLFGFTC